jgi:pSer/pThr/pTyr-binding forkhead associated (FHA) protein
MPCLRLKLDERLREQWELTANRFGVDRASVNDVVLRNPGGSKYHAHMERPGSIFVLFDNHRSNGVFVNNIALSRTDSGMETRYGDIRCGDWFASRLPVVCRLPTG